MPNRWLVPLVVALGVVGVTPPAVASSFRMVDRDGVIHLTNAPTGARYQRPSGRTGTSARSSAVRAGAHGRYAREITRAAVRYGVDPALVWSVIRAESAFNRWAVSHKGARGLMQLMPRTASALGVVDVFDPGQNIDGGVRYLRALLDRYEWNLPLALAAYNAGPRAVDGYGGIPPYPETHRYVRRIMSLYRTGSGAGTSRFIYRYKDTEGTVVYTNVPPIFRRR